MGKVGLTLDLGRGEETWGTPSNNNNNNNKRVTDCSEQNKTKQKQSNKLRYEINKKCWAADWNFPQNLFYQYANEGVMRALITEIGEEKQFNQLFLKHCHTVDAKS